MTMSRTRLSCVNKLLNDAPLRITPDVKLPLKEPRRKRDARLPLQLLPEAPEPGEEELRPADLLLPLLQLHSKATSVLEVKAVEEELARGSPVASAEALEVLEDGA